MTHEQRWRWYAQLTDVALLAAGLAVITTMIWRERYPINGILLVAFCAGGLTAGQLASFLRGRANGKPSD